MALAPERHGTAPFLAQLAREREEYSLPQVTEEDSYAYAVRAAREEGTFVGPPSGAALAAVEQKLPDIPDGSTVLTFCYDTGERYFPVEGLFESDGTAVQVGARGLRSP